MFCPHIVFMWFCMVLRTNGNYLPARHRLVGFYNRDGECLLRGTSWTFKYSLR